MQNYFRLFILWDASISMLAVWNTKTKSFFWRVLMEGTIVTRTQQSPKT